MRFHDLPEFVALIYATTSKLLCELQAMRHYSPLWILIGQ